jgi:hypothetical protein
VHIICVDVFSHGVYVTCMVQSYSAKVFYLSLSLLLYSMYICGGCQSMNCAGRDC